MKNNKLALSIIVAMSVLALNGCPKKTESETIESAAITADINPAQAEPDASAYLPDENRKFPERVLWGDQHVHTAWSFDAGIAGAKLDPEDSVRFARGEPVKADNGDMAKLHRALDWIAVTDHSDGLGIFNELAAGNPDMISDPTAKRWYEMMNAGPDQAIAAKKEVVAAQSTLKLPKNLLDPKWMVSAWQKNVDIMEKYNEPGKFTAFIAYEWTSNSNNGDNLHRNILFRDNADKTRAYIPLTTFISADPAVAGVDPESLWAWMSDWEAKSGGKGLVIPHNGNMSNGRMFELQRYNGQPLTKKWAEDRARWEVNYEIFQYKGSGEAHPKLSPNDEYANYGIWDTANLNGIQKKPDMLKTEYAREALKNGLLLQQKFGTNPFKFGLVSGTDTHNAMSTGGQEDAFYGKFAVSEPSPDRWKGVYKQEGSFTRYDWTLLAAGVTGVWSTSNTREAIWDALKRKEVYASSGPRITIRFFGGYDFSKADVKTSTLAATGYAKGVPMGGDLSAAPAGKSPTFLFAAMKDPMNANLDSMQIIKGWVDDAGKTHERIFNVAWSEMDKRKEINGKLAPVGNTVDLATATYTNSIGASELIGTFTDPEFNPKQRAFYYARAVEIPTPRWTAYDAVKFKVKMTDDVPMIQQERAVTSSIWYNPQ